MKINSIVFLILITFSFTSQSEVYKHVDKDGNVTYSNTPLRNGKELSLPPLTVIPKTTLELRTKDIKPQENYNKNQKEAVRKMIADEVKLLEAKRKEYNDGEPERFGSERNYQRYLDRVQRLKDEIFLHEENIKALEIELQDLASPN